MILSALLLVLILPAFINCDKAVFHTLGKKLHIKKAHKLCVDDVPTCNPSQKYRSFDGSCNNLKHPTWGMAQTPYERVFPAHYSDDKSLPRQAVSGRELPSARLLSSVLFTDESHEVDVSLAVMQFGQFLAHDILRSDPIDPTVNCCVESFDPQICAPIKVPETDSFYSQYNVNCQILRRSGYSTSGDCVNGPREQLNMVTHLIDGSQIYGSDAATASDLRENVGGRLRISKPFSNGRKYLPLTDVKKCDEGANVCYKAGDPRVNQNPELAVFQTLFLREHNRIADELSKIQPDWCDETLYQEARRILIGQYQRIVSNDLFPIYLGEAVARRFHLKPNAKGFTEYSDKINVNILNSFTASAFRVLHSGIQGILALYNYNFNPVKGVNISDWLNKPEIIQEENNFDEFLLGTISQKMQALDEYWTDEITTELFKSKLPFGGDLGALDIQRGRDHGLPNYIDVLKLCKGYKIKDFDDLGVLISEENVEKLKNLYESVEDVDFFVGGSLEKVSNAHKIGPTFECIITEQFYRIKTGDRFWYEIKGQPHSFTKQQMDEINKASLARIICDNSDYIKAVTKNVFYLKSDKNPIMPCDSIPKPNLQKWGNVN